MFTSPRIQTWNPFMWNKKRVVLRTTAPSIGCTVKGILIFLRILRDSIVYWAGEIVAVHIVHIPTQRWEDIICTICTAAISPAQYTIELQRSLKKKSIPLKVQPMEGAVVRKMTLFLLHMKKFRVRIPSKVNSLYSLRYLQIHYYKHYHYILYTI